MAGWWLKRQLFIKLRVYTYKKGMQKTMQNIHRTLHNTLHLFDYLNVTRCRICVLNPTQTLHWNRQNPTLKPAKPYTETGTETCKTLHKNYTRKPTPQPYILFFEHESNEWNEWTRMDRAERTERTWRHSNKPALHFPFKIGSGSAPRKNWERTRLKLGAHLRKTRSAPRKN